jgi:ribosomal protein S27AE
MAGRRYRYTWDQVNALSADYMARWGAFVHGCEATVGFDDEDEAYFINFTMNSDRDAFTARYAACRIRGTVRETKVSQEVTVERRPCRFGGHRLYFRCPSCWGATLRLAVLPEGLRCGRCGSITWGSRREHAPQRLIRRANKVAAKLHLYEWSDQPTERPLHMRTATFELLKVEKAMMAEMINDRLNRQFLRSARVRRLLAR